MLPHWVSCWHRKQVAQRWTLLFCTLNEEFFPLPLKAHCQLLVKEWAHNTGKLPVGDLPRNCLVMTYWEFNYKKTCFCISSCSSKVQGPLGSIVEKQMSRIMRKPTYCIGENKDADQLRGNREAEQRLCFRSIDSTILLSPKLQASSHLLWLYSLVFIRPSRKPECWFSHDEAH